MAPVENDRESMDCKSNPFTWWYFLFFPVAAVHEQKGKHAFKFIVDDEWRFAPDQPTVADIEGRVNNFIDVSDFVGYTGEENFEANRLKVRLFLLLFF